MEAGACSNGKERTPVGNSLNECPVRQGKDKRERDTCLERLGEIATLLYMGSLTFSIWVRIA